MTTTIALLEGIGGPELLFIGVLALLMFGSKRLPDLGRSFGKAMREFKKATSGVEENLREAMREQPATTIRPPAKPNRPRPVTASAIPAAEATTLADSPATKPDPTPAPPTQEPSEHGEDSGPERRGDKED